MNTSDYGEAQELILIKKYALGAFFSLFGRDCVRTSCLYTGYEHFNVQQRFQKINILQNFCKPEVSIMRIGRTL